MRIRPGSTVALVGEFGLGQIRHRAGDHGHPAAHRAHHRRRDPASTSKGGGSVDLAKLSPRSKEFKAIRGNRIGMIFQEPMTSFSPLHTIGEPDRRGARGAQEGHQGGEARAHHRDAAARRVPAPDRDDRLLSVRALRRTASARDDRHGADLPAGAAHRRRADDRARRDRAGADPEADPRRAERARHGRAPDHARSRRRRQHGRGGGRRASRQAWSRPARSTTSSRTRRTPT